MRDYMIPIHMLGEKVKMQTWKWYHRAATSGKPLAIVLISFSLFLLPLHVKVGSLVLKN